MSKNFADKPSEFFSHSLARAHHPPRKEIAALQLDALQRRFADLVLTLPPLEVLASQREVSAIESLDDAPAVFFHHSMYKSYPEEALLGGDFATLTDWLSNFTRHDLSTIAARDFTTLDGWLFALNTDTAMHVLHSSGTTGQLSFIPRGKLEHRFAIRHVQMAMAEIAKPGAFYPNNPDFAVVWPSFGEGYSGILTLGEMFRDAYCASPDDYYPLIPHRLSADYQLYIMQLENARAAGDEFIGAPNDYVQAAIDQSFDIRGSEQERNEAMLDKIAGEWRDKKIIFAGGPVILYNLAKLALAKGMENALAEGSRVITFGGFKGISPVGDEEAVIKRFTGAGRIQYLYGMTEVATGFLMCESGRYHIPPWIIPYVLDGETGEPKPREGTQSGIAAYMDLSAQSYWGGLISADRVEMSWEQCSCGRTTPHIGADIERVEE